MKSPWLETLVIRRSQPEDSAFFRELLAELADAELESQRATLDATLKLPSIPEVLADFAPPTALSVVATDGRNVRIGAAWASRSWTDSNAESVSTSNTPELRLAVRPEFQDRGVGSALLLALLSSLGREGIRAVNIIVEKQPSVQHLYERAGFQTVAERADAFIMVASLEGLVDHVPDRTRK